MKVTLFGATGGLGRECLEQALAAGHEVTVLARTPSKLPADLREKVTVVEGDGLDADAFEEGLGFDGSSIQGFEGIQSSDLLLFLDPTIGLIGGFVDCRMWDPRWGSTAECLSGFEQAV